MITRITIALVLFSMVKCCHGQLPVLPQGPLLSASATWFPTNSTTGKLVWWAELTPLNGTWGPDSATHPAADNVGLKLWTNYAATLGGVWTADQTLHPTNFVSGGGGNGTSPRIQFTIASGSSRLSSTSWPDASNGTNKFTAVIVANCTSTSGTDKVIEQANSTDYFQFNAHKLELFSGTLLSSAATTVAGTYYVISVVVAADASSHIDTNGVVMVTGNAGSATWSAMNIGDNFGNPYHGNVSRVWVWDGVLGSTDLANAVAQCRKDFGI